MSDDEEMFYGAQSPDGHTSGRKYTRKEIAAARRFKMVHGHITDHSLTGAIYWATGDYCPDYLTRQRKAAEQRIRDCNILADAFSREWDNIDKGYEGQ